MDQSERRDRIVEYLKVKPISHGQVYTFQIAVPQSEAIEISAERRESLQRSLTEQGSNLIPLIVRRTEAYDEGIDYEVVYGADWYLVAKEIDIEKLWVWVFNLTDEQATKVRAQMNQLVESVETVSPPPVSPLSKVDTQELSKQILEPLQEQIKLLASKLENIEKNTSVKPVSPPILTTPSKVDTQELSKQILEPLQEQIKPLTSKLENIEEITSVDGLDNILRRQFDATISKSDKLNKEEALSLLKTTKETLDRQVKVIQKEIGRRNKLDLTKASKDEIGQALKEKKAANKDIDAAWDALEHWKQKKSLAWKNLERSAKAKSRSEDKIRNFAIGTYEKLRQIGDIE